MGVNVNEVNLIKLRYPVILPFKTSTSAKLILDLQECLVRPCQKMLLVQTPLICWFLHVTKGLKAMGKTAIELKINYVH